VFKIKALLNNRCRCRCTASYKKKHTKKNKTFSKNIEGSRDYGYANTTKAGVGIEACRQEQAYKDYTNNPIYTLFFTAQTVIS